VRLRGAGCGSGPRLFQDPGRVGTDPLRTPAV
jgi:hypothetical protein